MRPLDFPISASAARIHAREFQAQDFFDSAAGAVDGGAAGSSGAASRRSSQEQLDPWHSDHGRRSSARARARALVRWTLACVALALVVALGLSWLVRPNQEHATWVDSAASSRSSSGN